MVNFNNRKNTYLAQTLYIFSEVRKFYKLEYRPADAGRKNKCKAFLAC